MVSLEKGSTNAGFYTSNCQFTGGLKFRKVADKTWGIPAGTRVINHIKPFLIYIYIYIYMVDGWFFE